MAQSTQVEEVRDRAEGAGRAPQRVYFPASDQLGNLETKEMDTVDCRRTSLQQKRLESADRKVKGERRRDLEILISLHFQAFYKA